MKTVTLKPGREKSLRRRHPWIFSGALQDPDRDLVAGETVAVATAAGEVLALAAWSPASQIRARVWSFDADEVVAAPFFRRRIERAVRLRRDLFDDGSDACRLINAEADGLPGIIVDRYADFLVCQLLSAGAEYQRDTLLQQLQEVLRPRGIYERSDTEARGKEGLPLSTGTLTGEAPPEYIEVRCAGSRQRVDVRRGHKTGLYLDQARNRRLVEQCAGGRSVLNCFAYSGAFTVSALHGGAASVTAVDSSAEALALAETNVLLNELPAERVESVQADCFQELRRYRDAGRRFDMVILDPPRFVASARQLKRGSRGYKDVNLQAMKLLNDDGLLMTFSCSGHVSPALFQKIVADAASDAGRDARITAWLSQAPDHPVALACPEGHYLKGLVCRV